ncbi:MAG: helix-turn-helix domain-containing protein, partial [Atopobiaceae bacterium]|nr:helix-turn-helix domain-containing protein [Atopobiaceae bacterium]
MGIENESFGRRIARLRLMKGMTQERLANLANVSAQAVSKWENDLSYPDIMLLPVLADVFGVSIDELLGRTVEARTVIMPQPEPESEPEPEPLPEPETFEPVPAGRAICLHIHIIEKGNDALNLRIPLAAARALSSFPGLIAGYTAGIDLGELAS